MVLAGLVAEVAVVVLLGLVPCDLEGCLGGVEELAEGVGEGSVDGEDEGLGVGGVDDGVLGHLVVGAEALGVVEVDVAGECLGATGGDVVEEPHGVSRAEGLVYQLLGLIEVLLVFGLAGVLGEDLGCGGHDLLEVVLAEGVGADVVAAGKEAAGESLEPGGVGVHFHDLGFGVVSALGGLDEKVSGGLGVGLGLNDDNLLGRGGLGGRVILLVELELGLGDEGLLLGVGPVGSRKALLHLEKGAISGSESPLKVGLAVKELEVVNLLLVGLEGLSGKCLAVGINGPAEPFLRLLASGDMNSEGDVAGHAGDLLGASERLLVVASLEKRGSRRIVRLEGGDLVASTGLTEVGSVSVGHEGLVAFVEDIALDTRISPGDHLGADGVPLVVVDGGPVKSLEVRKHRTEGTEEAGIQGFLEGEAHVNGGHLSGHICVGDW